jgi:Cu/Ag efflux protein CusF
MRVLAILVAAAAIVTLGVGSATAQSQAPQYAPPVPGAPPVPAETLSKNVEGTVKKVDSAAKSVQVSSGLLGLGGATMSVTEETKITVQGKEGSFADIREGAKVKAAYESRGGKNVAKSIEVMAAEEKKNSAGRPGPGVSPPMGTIPGTSPSQPKTP